MDADGRFRFYRRGQGDPGSGTATRDFQKGDEIPADGVTSGVLINDKAALGTRIAIPQDENRRFSINLGDFDGPSRGMIADSMVDLVRRLQELGLPVDAAYHQDTMHIQVTVSTQPLKADDISQDRNPS